MILEFEKYQGTGNDFILIDNRKLNIKLSTKQVALLCNRNFGIGGDGLMLLQNKTGYDFEMVYYNSDGKKSSMCGNGGRCIVNFALSKGVFKDKAYFLAPDGPHDAVVNAKVVKLKMNDSLFPAQIKSDYFINTGSPHYVRFLNKISDLDVFKEGRKVRYSKRFVKEGTNVNFVEVLNSSTLFVRTYERGVENETLSCGTGVTAAALVYSSKINKKQSFVNIVTKGGKLKVHFKKEINNYTDIWLEGPAVKTFEGTIEI